MSCIKGDIIFVKDYIHEGKHLKGHPFVVLSDEPGQIYGVDFNLVALVMSSFKNEEQRKRKLSYPGNFAVSASEKTISGKENKDAFIKAEQLYYFDTEKLDYTVIGQLSIDVWEALLDFMDDLAEKGIEFKDIVDNIQ